MNPTTTTAPTTAELLAEYNAITYNKHGHNDENEARAAELARAVLESDLSGKLPSKGEKITATDVTGQLFPRPILAPNPGKLTPLQAAAEFVSTDTQRPAMCGVYHHTYTDCGTTRSAAVGTCGHTLGVFPAEAPAADVILNVKTWEPLKNGDKVGRETVDETPTRYPDYQNCIPTAGRTNPAYTITDIQAVRNILAGILRACAFIDCQLGGLLACIQHNGESFFFSPAFLARALRTLQATGTTRVQVELSTPNRAAVLRDVDCPEKLVLVMPIQYGGYFGIAAETRPWALLIDTAIAQDAMPTLTPAKLKPAPRKPAVAAPVAVAETVAPNFDNVSTIEEFAAAMDDAAWENITRLHAMPQLKRGQRVSIYLESEEATVTSRKGLDYWVKYDDGTRALHSRGDLTVVEPTTAQQQPPTSPAICDKLHPLAFTHKGVDVRRVRKDPADPTARLTNYWYLLGGVETDVRSLPTYREPAYLDAYQFGDCAADIAAEAHRVLRLAIDAMQPTSPAPEPTAPTTTPAPTSSAPHPDFIRYKRTQKLARLTAKMERLKSKHYAGDELSAHFPLGSAGSAGKASAKLNARKNAGMDRMIDDSLEIKRLQVEINKLNWHLAQPAKVVKPVKSPRPKPEPTERERKIYTWYSYGTLDELPPADLTEEELQAVRQKFRNGMNLQPATFAGEAVWTDEHAAVHPLHTPPCTSPASPAAPMPKPRRNLFSHLTTQGKRVRLLHQIGKCAVAHVTPTEPTAAPYYLARWRSHYQQFAHLDGVTAALWDLRRMENAAARRDAELLGLPDFLAALPEYPPAAVAEFFAHHGLDPGTHYPRRDLRATVLAAKLPKYQKYLSWIHRVSPTNPA